MPAFRANEQKSGRAKCLEAGHIVHARMAVGEAAIYDPVLFRREGNDVLDAALVKRRIVDGENGDGARCRGGFPFNSDGFIGPGGDVRSRTGPRLDQPFAAQNGDCRLDGRRGDAEMRF